MPRRRWDGGAKGLGRTGEQRANRPVTRATQWRLHKERRASVAHNKKKGEEKENEGIQERKREGWEGRRENEGKGDGYGEIEMEMEMEKKKGKEKGEGKGVKRNKGENQA